jgi:energy-coupling factor transporter transmembrane protein EcfT
MALSICYARVPLTVFSHASSACSWRTTRGVRRELRDILHAAAARGAANRNGDVPRYFGQVVVMLWLLIRGVRNMND